jgi:type VI secretion system lysozyme-like protein
MESRHQRGVLNGRTGAVAGLAVPLFDRFDEERDDSRMSEPYKIHELQLVLESIQKEIENLLSTRLPTFRDGASSWEPLSQPQTVLDYGLPEFAPIAAGNPLDQAFLSAVIAAKIAAFEPRLQNPMVELHGVADNPSQLIGTLEAAIKLQGMSHPVRFPFFLDRGEGATVLTAEQP